MDIPPPRQPAADPPAASWTLYLLRSPSLGSTYAGIARDLERRLAQHNGELPGGAKSTRAGRPWECVATWGPFEDRGAAQAAEYQLKRLPGRARADFRLIDAPDSGGQPG